MSGLRRGAIATEVRPAPTGQIILGGYSGYDAGSQEAAFLTSIGASPPSCVIVDYSNSGSTTWPNQLGNYAGLGNYLAFPGGKVWSFAMAIAGHPLDWTSITSGANDSTFNAMFNWAASNNVQFMRPGWEFNLTDTNTPWGVGGNDTPTNRAGFIAAWQHFWNLAHAIRPNYFKWWWNPTMGLDAGLVGIFANYYPGDPYVDGVGIDIYNHYSPSSTWPGDSAWLNAMTSGTDPNWNDTVSFCQAHGKAVLIPEWAPVPTSSTSGQPSSPGDDPTYVTNMFNLFTAAANAGLTVYSLPYNASSNWANFPNSLAELKAQVALGISSGLIAGPTNTTIYGAYAGSNNYAGVQAFAAATGLNITAVSDYCDGSSWAGIENPPLSNFVGQGKRLCLGINMGPDALFSGHGGNTTTTLTQGSHGDFNSHYVTLATNLVAQGFTDCICRIGWEFGANQPWSPTSSSDPPLYASYFAQIVTAMRSVSGQHFVFDWNPLWGFTNFSETAAYPGDAFVDIISTDIYDQSYSGTCFPPSGQPGNTATTAQSNCAFNDMRTTNNNPLNGWLAMASSHHKHWAAPEWGVNNDQAGAAGHGLGDDPQFITNMFNLKNETAAYYMSYFAFDYGGSNLFDISDGSFPNALARLMSLFG